MRYPAEQWSDQRYHRADNVEVVRHAEIVFGIRESNRCFVIPPEAFGSLNQSNEFAENLGDIATIDFVNDQDIL